MVLGGFAESAHLRVDGVAIYVAGLAVKQPNNRLNVSECRLSTRYWQTSDVARKEQVPTSLLTSARRY